MNLLSEEGKVFLENYEQQKKRHRASQKEYRLQHQDQIKKYKKNILRIENGNLMK